MARTIDDLPIETSNRYAEDQEIYQQNLVKEAGWIPTQTKVTTTSPSYTSEFDALFDLNETRALWASFLPPPKYGATRRRLFAEQIIPALGSPDLQDAKLERLESVTEESEEKRILSNLLKNLHLFDQILIDINARRNQYQKG